MSAQLPAATLQSSLTRVIVGMSGGVDSSVAALLLQRQGYEVRGAFMKNWEETDPQTPCTAAEDARDAMDVCERLGIELDAVNFTREYWDRVFAHFLAEYRHGRTPNPDILCNKEIKFRAFLEHALALGADYIATGHYARNEYRNGQWHLLKARDTHKDQTYFLYTLGQQQLAHTLFPLGEMIKSEVRAIAAEVGFGNATKKDSTGICFIGERDFDHFLSRYLPAQSGDIRTPEGELLGEHRGLMYYTLGQRKGIGIGGRRDAAETPWYVVEKDLTRNTLIVAQGDHPLLYSRGLLAADLHWVSGHPPRLPLRCHAKTRYRQREQACVISAGPQLGLVHVAFEQAQRAVTPGQAVVFYQAETCLGGGTIEQIER